MGTKMLLGALVGAVVGWLAGDDQAAGWQYTYTILGAIAGMAVARRARTSKEEAEVESAQSRREGKSSKRQDK